MRRKMMAAALAVALAGSAQGAVTLVPDVVATYVTPGDVLLKGGDFDAAGVLHLSIPSSPSPGVDHLTFDPGTGLFTGVGGYLPTGGPDWDWALMTTGEVVEYSMAYTGWADFCPDGTYHAVGWGGSNIQWGTTWLGYDREIWGVAVRPDGAIVLLAGIVMNPCIASAPTLELVTITEGDYGLAEGTTLAALDGTTAGLWGTSHTTLDHDADNDLYWTLEQDTGSGYWFAGFDATGVHRYRMAAPGYEGTLVHHEANRYFLVDGSSTLTLLELDLASSVGDWMVLGE